MTLTTRLHFANLITRSIRARDCNRGVRVMSFDYRNMKYIPFPESKFVPKIVAPYVMPKDRPLRQRIALLLMRRSELATKVRAAVNDTDAPRVTVADFAPLVAEGWVSKDGEWHRLTQAGVSIADVVIKDLARQFGIHHYSASSGGRFDNFMSCTCGRTFSHSRNEGHWESAKMRMWSKHLTEIEEAKARGEVYMPPELRVLKIIDAAFAPTIVPEG